MLKKVAKVLIKKEDKYLVLRRPKDTKRYPNAWDIPGGKLEEGENELEALKREIAEEICTNVKIIKEIFSFTNEISAKIYLAETTCGRCQISLSDEHTEYKWLTLEELKNLDDCEIVLDHYIKSLN